MASAPLPLGLKPQPQCYHCHTTSTPCWRKGPPEKPVLCNACGARFLVKNSLDGYYPGTKAAKSAGLQGGVVKKPKVPKPHPATALKQLKAPVDRFFTEALFSLPHIAFPAPVHHLPQQFYSTAIDEAAMHASEGSDNDAASSDQQLAYRSDVSSVDSQEDLSMSASAMVAGMFSSLLSQPVLPLPMASTTRPCAARYHRCRARKQAHPTPCF